MASTDPGSCGWGFGSDGRGDTGVGSDLDLLLIDAHAVGPQHHPLLAWPLAELPLRGDALVLTPAEQRELLASGAATAITLARVSWPATAGSRQPLVVELARPPLARYSASAWADEEGSCATVIDRPEALG